MVESGCSEPNSACHSALGRTWRVKGEQTLLHSSLSPSYPLPIPPPSSQYQRKASYHYHSTCIRSWTLRDHRIYDLPLATCATSAVYGLCQYLRISFSRARAVRGVGRLTRAGNISTNATARNLPRTPLSTRSQT